MSVLPRGTHCHKLLRGTAIELAAAVYDELALRNDWYDAHKKRYQDIADKPNALMLAWIDEHWPDFIEEARMVLVEMLSRNDVSELVKEEAHEALTKDQRFREGRRRAATRKLAKLTRVLEH